MAEFYKFISHKLLYIPIQIGHAIDRKRKDIYFIKEVSGKISVIDFY